MATSEQQKRYARRYREKRKKIASFALQLDRAVASMEKLPSCPECLKEAAQTGQRPECLHSPERRRWNEEAQLARSQLQELDH
jgi:hypothetical protein